MQPSRLPDDSEGDGTLAGASGQALSKFLKKRQSRKGQQKELSKDPGAGHSILPRASQAAAQDGPCGAPAVAHKDEEHKQPSRTEGRSGVEDAPRAAVPWLPSGGAAGVDDGDDWEAASDFEGFFEEVQAEGTPSDNGLVISIGTDAGPPSHSSEGQQRARRRFSKEEILTAAVVHQSHLLCLLAAGRLLDLAAAHPLPQAAALSTVPGKEVQRLAARKSNLVATDLNSLVGWFKQSFQLSEEGAPSKGLEALAGEEGGVAVAVQRLKAAAEKKRGTAEELVGLFVAILRASGFLVRFVRVLDPLPWRPSLRERYVPTKKRQTAKRRAEAEEAAEGPSKKSKKGTAAKSRGRKTAVHPEEETDGVAPDDGEMAQSPEASPAPKAGKQVKPKASQKGRTAKRKGTKTVAEEVVNSPEAERRPGKGDLEFENQMAMALMASGQPKDPAGGTSKTDEGAKPSKSGKLLSLREVIAKGQAGEAGGSGAAWERGSHRGQAADCWAEIYCSGEDKGNGRWVHVHPLLGWIDKPELVEGASVRLSQLAYVVAFAGGGAKDITPRYISNLLAAEKLKKPNAKWWAKTLKPLRSAEIQATQKHLSHEQPSEPSNPTEPLPGPADSIADAKRPTFTAARGGQSLLKLKQEVEARANREDGELKRKLEQQEQEVPTTLDGFKRHKHFILQRHVTRYSAIRPGAQKAGYHRGEPYFRTADVSELHTAEKWVQAGLEVRPEELGRPFKVVAKRGSKKKAADATALKDAGDAEEEAREEPGDESVQTKLYGRWQTKEWRAPVAKDGIVPKNERGTVHCPPLAASLPQGTRQLDKPRIAGICKRLEVDYAMAMTGFDMRGGRSVPRFEGVVVCEEFAEAVLEQWEKEQSEIAEKEATKRMEGARTTWISLLRAIFTRIGLQDQQEAVLTAKTNGSNPSRAPATAARDSDEEEEEEKQKKPTRRKATRAGGQRKRQKAKKANQGTQAEEDVSNAGAAVEYEEI